MSAEVINRTVFFLMIDHPIKGWTRVGNAHATRETAASWRPFVRASWRGICRVKVSQFTARFVDGKLSERSREVLDKKYNLTSEGL